MFKSKSIFGIPGILFLGVLIGLSIPRNYDSVAQSKKYPYLSNLYNESYTPTFADWRALDLTAAHNNESYLSDKLIKTGFGVYLLPTGITVGVGTKTQPSWDTYLGNGRFSVSDRELRAAYLEAVEEIFEIIDLAFIGSGLQRSHVKIIFSIRGSDVATFKNNQLKLEGE